MLAFIRNVLQPKYGKIFHLASKEYLDTTKYILSVSRRFRCYRSTDRYLTRDIKSVRKLRCKIIANSLGIFQRFKDKNN